MDDETRLQQEQIATHRRNLQYLVEQAAQFGSEVMAPLPARNQLHQTRTAIADLKARAPLWKIDDDEALRFASQFYEQTLQQGEQVGSVL
jgi:hypothetical protein